MGLTYEDMLAALAAETSRLRLGVIITGNCDLSEELEAAR